MLIIRAHILLFGCEAFRHIFPHVFSEIDFFPREILFFFASTFGFFLDSTHFNEFTFHQRRGAPLDAVFKKFIWNTEPLKTVVKSEEYRINYFFDNIPQYLTISPQIHTLFVGAFFLRDKASARAHRKRELILEHTKGFCHSIFYPRKNTSFLLTVSILALTLEKSRITRYLSTYFCRGWCGYFSPRLVTAPPSPPLC